MSGGIKVVGTNRKAYHDYHVEETLEAGIVLMGSEVKSIANGKINLTDAYCRVLDGELWLLHAHVSHYDPAARYGHEERRKRKLLAHRKEIDRLQAKILQKGLTLIPLKVYFKGGKAKVEVGLCRGKREYDKRETIKEKDMKKQLERDLSERR